MEPNSARLCSLAGRYHNPIPTRFLAHIDCLKIPALEYDGPLCHFNITQEKRYVYSIEPKSTVLLQNSGARICLSSKKKISDRDGRNFQYFYLAKNIFDYLSFV
jgi:hypothetical protein